MKPQTLDVIDSYPSVGGATVDVTYAPHSGLLRAACTAGACGWSDWTSTASTTCDPPEKEAALVEKWLPTMKEHAQAHAGTCRAKGTSEATR